MLGFNFLSPFYSVGLQSTGWCLPRSGWVSLLQPNLETPDRHGPVCDSRSCHAVNRRDITGMFVDASTRQEKRQKADYQELRARKAIGKAIDRLTDSSALCWRFGLAQHEELGVITAGWGRHNCHPWHLVSISFFPLPEERKHIRHQPRKS